jgi:deoxyxylulose-5-phosphate synthase
VSVIKLNRIVPLDPAAVALASEYGRVVFLEEGYARSGIAAQFLCALAIFGYRGKAQMQGFDGFVAHAPVERTLGRFGFDVEGILELLRRDPGQETGERH